MSSFTYCVRVHALLSFRQNATRNISTTCCNQGKRNFRKFVLNNKRGSKLYKKNIMESPEYPLYDLGVRIPGYKEGKQFRLVPEQIPEIIVPDLEGFTLKPYVSYKAEDVVQSEFTSLDLFKAVYDDKIVKDFKNNKLDEEGNPLEPSPEEQLTPERAWVAARKTGSDIM